MSELNVDRRFGQVINYYLDLAASGAHSPTGEPRTEKYLRTSRGLADSHIPGDVRQERFLGLDLQRLQHLLDEAAVRSEKAAVGLRRFLHDLDTFAAHIGLLPEPRTKELRVPGAWRRERLLDDRALGTAWTALIRCSDAGTLPSRISCLATLVSAATLQPIGSVLDLRRDWLTPVGWIRHDTGHQVYAPALVRPWLELAIDKGDRAHGEGGTPLVFPSAGKGAQPDLPISLETVHDMCKLALDDVAKPQDLAFTGLQRLRESGAGVFADRIAGPCRGAPDAAHLAILDAWTGQLEELRKSSEAKRWR